MKKIYSVRVILIQLLFFLLFLKYRITLHYGFTLTVHYYRIGFQLLILFQASLKNYLFELLFVIMLGF